MNSQMSDEPWRLSATIEDYLRYLAPAFVEDGEPPTWPPDVFAVALSLLRKSGAYDQVVRRWPPSAVTGSWTRDVARAADEWYEVASGHVPSRVSRRWKSIQDHLHETLADIRCSTTLTESLLALVAVSDEAMAGIESHRRRSDEAPRSEPDTRIWQQATRWLNERNNLCSEAVNAQVLPKYLSPRSGLSLRSLSHYLCLNPHDEVSARWYRFPTLLSEESGEPRDEAPVPKLTVKQRPAANMNILMWPWPRKVAPSQFKEVEGKLNNLPHRYGFFEYRPVTSGGSLVSRFDRLLSKAREWVGEIHMVVLPEMAVTSSEYIELRKACSEEDLMLVAGVLDQSGGEAYAVNKVQSMVPVPETWTQVTQKKHHRWLIDGPQIRQYGLGARLDPGRLWWEAIEVDEREICVYTLDQWLSMCCLVCEDLAQAEPVSALLRAIGPSFVLALLMDGPQLRERWSSRYATVLADDPGSSVLTFTSLGMATLCRPPGMDASRVVGLWKDSSRGETIELVLDPESEGLVVSLSAQYDSRWSADGRRRNPEAGYPALTGIHQIGID